MGLAAQFRPLHIDNNASRTHLLPRGGTDFMGPPHESLRADPGAFWMIRWVLRDGWTVEAAEREAKRIVVRDSPHLNEFARWYIEKHRKKK